MAVERLRTLEVAKRPGVAETIDWANAISFLGADTLESETALETLGVVAKDHEDQQVVVAHLEEVLGGDNVG